MNTPSTNTFSNTDIATMNIAIVGGGPAGLTLARLLQQRGLHVTVYERDHHRSARVQGTTLDLHTDAGLLALDAAGLLDAFKAHYLPMGGILRISDEHGALQLDEHASEADSLPGDGFGHEHFRPEIDRGPLRDILLDSLEPGTVVWDSQIVSLERQGAGWEIHFRNGQSATADLVIAADGVNSRVRPAITDLQPQYTGVTIVEISVEDAAHNAPRMAELVRGGKLWALGTGHTVMFSAKGDGSLSVALGFRVGADWLRHSGLDFTDRAQLLAWFRQEFAGWDAVWEELFQTEHATFTPRQILCMPIDQNWTAQPDITMIGDAAHVMPPYAGEGVNVAMLDALKLSDYLTSSEYPDVASAIAAFEAEMRGRSRVSMEESLRNTDLFHSAGALETMVGAFSGGHGEAQTA